LVISSFKDADTAALFRDELVPRFRSIERPARRKLLYLSRARVLQDLRVPPGNRLEALRGSRKGQHSIRINDQWRICFRWRKDGVHDVEIVDYH
jgi:proteic killer suppression protein